MSINKLAGFIFTVAGVWPHVNGCYNNQRLGFCPRKRIVFQDLCEGVAPWACNYVDLRCGCVKGTARRSDGQCVKPEECDAGAKKTDSNDGKKTEATPKDPVQTPFPVDHTTLPVKEIVPPKQALYYSGESLGCPSRDDRCTSHCKARGFDFGLCDPVISKYCYCGPMKSTAPPQRPGWDGRKYSLHWPYGLLVGNGYLIQELKEANYGCPGNEDACFSECMRRGVQGAFCGEHQHCYCEAQLPAHIWENSREFEIATDESGVTNCTSRDICDGTCKALWYTGGYCPKDESDTCYCYNMFMYNQEFTKLLEAHSRNPVAKDTREHVMQLLQSRRRLVLVQVSEAAWGGYKCHCMESNFLQQGRQGTLRSVVCHLFAHVKAENVTLQVERDSKSMTRIHISGGSEHLPFALAESYVVLTATATCAVVQNSEAVRGRPLCALWGFDDARNNEEAEEICFRTMRTMCMQPVIFTYTQKEDCDVSWPTITNKRRA